jgi:hypothetical protein
VQLVAALLVIALVAERRLLGTSPLGGGALVPAWGGASGLWHEYLAGFHAVGVGSTASAPPYLAVVAALATVLGGQSWLAVDVLLLSCVPLAGLTAYIAARRLVTSTAARLWLAGSYALLPVAIGAVAAGRLGSAFAFTMLPLIGLNAARMVTSPPRAARRAAWATGLLVALAAAFVPLLWVFAAAFAVVVLAARRWLWPVHPLDAAIVVATPFVVLFPWSLHLFANTRVFLTEAGVLRSGLSADALRPSALLLLSPGGPGLPPVWVTAGIGLAVLAAVIPHRRTALTASGWCVAAAGFLGAVVVSRSAGTQAEGGQAVHGWPGAALAVAALGLLLAAAPAADWLANAWTGRGFARKLGTVVALIAAATAPVLVAAYWLADGVRGPIGSVTQPVLPAFVSASSSSQAQYRTLILRPGDGSLDYAVVRQSDPTLGEPELTASTPAENALSQQVAALAAPDGADAGDPGLVLGDFGIRWVLLPGPVDPALAQRLDASSGLVPLSKASAYDLWQVAGPVARVRVIARDGAVTPLSSQTVGMSPISAPVSGGTLVLAEPYGGWTATLNGAALKPLAAPVDGWAQGFVLPPGGGKVAIARNNMARDLSLMAELVALLAVIVLALPGKRADQAAEAEAMAAVRAAQHGRRAARSGRVRRGVRRAPLAADAERATRGAGRGIGLAGRAVAGLGVVRRRASAPRPGTEVALRPGSGVGVLANGDAPDQTEQWNYRGQWDDNGQWEDDGQPDGDDQWDDAGQWDDSGQRADVRQLGRRTGLTGPQPAAPRGTGPQSAAPWEADPGGTSWDTGPQPAAPWETRPQTDAWDTGPLSSRGSGPQPSWDGVPRPTRGSGPQPSWDNGSQESWDNGSQESWDNGSQGSWDNGSQESWDDGPEESWDTGPHATRGTGPQASWRDEPSWDAGNAGGREPAAERTARTERHSHRARRHARPSRRRGSGERSGSEGES